MVTFEETNALVDAACTTCGKATVAAAAPASSLASICSVYGIIKPILKAIEAIPFFPANWKTAIDGFFKVMDALCPASPAPAAAPAASLTEEAVTAQVKQALLVYLQVYDKPAVAAMAASNPNPGAQICAAYKAIKPILDFAKQFIPGLWGTAVAVAEEALDLICK